LSATCVKMKVHNLDTVGASLRVIGHKVQAALQQVLSGSNELSSIYLFMIEVQPDDRPGTRRTWHVRPGSDFLRVEEPQITNYIITLISNQVTKTKNTINHAINCSTICFSYRYDRE
jgi:hypothetical protein